MKFIKSILLLILAGATFIFAIVLVLAGLLAVDPQVTAFIIHTISKITHPIFLIGFGLLTCVFALFLLTFVGGRSDSSGTLTFEGEKGPIDISLRALEDYIGKHFEHRPVAHSVRTKAGTSRDRKRIRVRASISVWSEQSLKNAGDTVQNEIIRCLKEGLGLDNVESVRVSVDKIIASKSRKPAPLKAPPEAPENEAP